MFERVLVPVGDVTRDAELLRYARVVRKAAPGAAFCFIHVLGWEGQSSREEPVTHEKAFKQLAEAVDREFGGDVRITCRVVHGNIVDRLLETAVESASDLILVGHAVEHSGRRALARRLAMKAPCSVWMRPEGSAVRISRILAAVDFSEPSAYALRMAAHIARCVGLTECLALHAYLDEAVAGLEEYASAIRTDHLKSLERFMAPLDMAGLTVRPLVDEAPSVAHSVERAADQSGVDLVVMGSRGQSRSVSILLGSESDHVLTESKIPVLIAKRRGERIGLLQALLDRDFRLPDSPRFG